MQVLIDKSGNNQTILHGYMRSKFILLPIYVMDDWKISYHPKLHLKANHVGYPYTICPVWL